MARLRPVRFSNRPFRVKHFQTIHRCAVDVAHGLVLLFGIGTKALPSWDSRTRRNNLTGGLAIRLMVGPSGHSNSPYPSSREGHHSTARVELEFSPIAFDPAWRSCRYGFPGPPELTGGLAIRLMVGPSGHSNSPYPSSREGHHSTARVELESSPIAFDPAWRSCRYGFPGPPELGAVNPNAVHDHGQPTRQGYNRRFHPAAPGDLHCPGLEP